jgi:hypothetical protein
LDNRYPFDPQERAYRLAAPNLLERSRELAEKGEIEPALATWQALTENLPDFTIPANILSSVAWDGCTHGFDQFPEALQLKLLQAAEQAVTLAPDKPGYRDNRGLCRALHGDVTGAIEDFQAYVDWIAAQEEVDETMQDQRQQRQAWIAALQAGENPFTEAVLTALREE